jgi:selenocysteine lyase/cysteine desulfurase
MAMTLEFESNPDRFVRLTYLPRLDRVRERLSTLVGADADDCVIVPNVSIGISTILRNFEWRETDILVSRRRHVVASRFMLTIRG